MILTHEQADFDALAALLAAHILNEHTLPVLPRRMNCNVRAFLNLYGSELPYVEARDLPAEAIETITLVDTQSLITLKGMTSDTQVHVIDHHQVREDLPADWSLVTEKLGAITTLFVEEIQDRNGPLKYAAGLCLTIRHLRRHRLIDLCKHHRQRRPGGGFLARPRRKPENCRQLPQPPPVRRSTRNLRSITGQRGNFTNQWQTHHRRHGRCRQIFRRNFNHRT